MAIEKRPSEQSINDLIRGDPDGSAVPASMLTDQAIKRVMLSRTFWMVRAGERGFRFDDLKASLVEIG